MQVRRTPPGQLWFDFGPVRLPRFDRPSNDNEWLLTLQAMWLEDGDGEARIALWEESRRIAERCVMGMYASRGIKYTRDDVDDRASDAMLYVFRRYDNPSVRWRKTTYRRKFGWNYCVLSNFVSVIRQGVRHAVDWRSKADSLVTYVDYDTVMALSRSREESGGDDYDMP